MEKQNKTSRFKKIVYSVLVLLIGFYAGYKFFSPNSGETPLPVKNTLYRASSNGPKTTNSNQTEEFTGKIFEVKKGDLIMDAVKEAKSGDLIRVYPGTYSETVYIDKDDITFQGIIKDGNWPTLDGKKELNDAFLYSGNGIHIEGFKIIN